VWAVLALAALAWALSRAGLFAGELVNPGGWTLVERFLGAALRPETSPEFLERAARATFTTLAFAACGTFLSLIFGAVGGVLASEVWWKAVFRSRGRTGWLGYRAPWLAVRAALAVPRAIHEIVWGLFFIALVGLDPLVGVLAIAIPYGAITAKIFSEILDETQTRPLEALLNRGVKPLGAFLYSQVPQAFPDLLSYAFYRFECSIRSAAVLGIIGAGGLGYEIFLSLQSLRYEQMWTFLGALILLTGLTDLWSGVIRRRTGSPHRVDISLGTERRTAAELEGGPWWRRAAGAAAALGRPEGEEGEPPAAAPIHASAGAGRSPDGAAAGAGGGGTVDGGEAGSAGPSAGPAVDRPTGPERDPVVRWSLVAGGLLLVLSFWHVGPSFGQLAEPRTLEMWRQISGEAFPPSLGGMGWGRIVELSSLTLAMSILAVAGAAVAGIAFSFPAATNFLLPGGILIGERASAPAKAAGTGLWGLTRGLLLFLRAVPAPIWALILLFVFFPGILPGAIALGLYTAGVLGRLMAEVTENLDARPLRALKAQGASGLQVFLYGVLPATVPRFLSYVLYRWEVTIRATVMVGLVGAGGLGRLLTEQLSSFDFRGVLATLTAYVVLTFLVDMVSARVRQDLR
jgi:phosphonate transport system permease protein